jgi:integrase
MAAYEAAMAGETMARLEIGASRTKPGTLSDAIVRYYRSVPFTNGLSEASQKQRRQVLDRFRNEHGEGNAIPRGDRQLRTLTQAQLVRIVAKHKPHVQLNLLKALRSLMAFAIAENLIEVDPTIGIKRVRLPKTGGFYSWSEQDIAKFEACHLIGSKARLAFALMLYLGLRRSDAVRAGPQHIRHGVFSIKPKKTERTTGIIVDIPVHPELARIIAATPSRHLTFLATEYGKPFTPAGFGNWMRQQCDEAGLPQCSSHGLRKGCGSRLAEAGCSANEIAAILGHTDLREVQIYTEAADRKRLARQAMARMQGPAEGPKGEQNWQTGMSSLPIGRKI